MTIHKLANPLIYEIRKWQFAVAPKPVKSQPKVRSRQTKDIAKLPSSTFWLIARNDWRILSRLANPFLGFILVFLLPLLMFLLGFNSPDGSPKDPVIVASALITLSPSLYALFLVSGFWSHEKGSILLRSAPISLPRLQLYKHLAGLIPIGIMHFPTVIALGLMGLPWLPMALFGLMASISAGVLSTWAIDITAKPQANSSLGVSDNIRDGWLLSYSLISLVFWPLSLILILKGHVAYGLLVLVVEGCMVLLAYGRDRQLRRKLGL